MWMLVLAMIPSAADRMIGGRLDAINKTSLSITYLTRDGRGLRATLRVTDKTEFVKDGKPIERSNVRPGEIIRVTVQGRTATRIVLPNTVRTVKMDEEILVDGDIEAIDLKAGSLTIEKTNGKKLTVKLPADTEVQLDGNESSLAALKPGQAVRVGVLRKARKVTRIFIFEVTTRPI